MTTPTIYRWHGGDWPPVMGLPARDLTPGEFAGVVARVGERIANDFWKPEPAPVAAAPGSSSSEEQ